MRVTGLFEHHIKKSFEMCKVVAINMLFLELGMSLMGATYLEGTWNEIFCSDVFVLPNFPVLSGTENKEKVTLCEQRWEKYIFSYIIYI